MRRETLVFLDFSFRQSALVKNDGEIISGHRNDLFKGQPGVVRQWQNIMFQIAHAPARIAGLQAYIKVFV